MLENENLEDFENRVEEICLKLLADAEKAGIFKRGFLCFTFRRKSGNREETWN